MISKKRLKEVDEISNNLDVIMKDLYPNEETAKKHSRGLTLNTGIGIDH